MKYLSLQALSWAMCGSLILASPYSQAASSGTITFNGKIVANTCNVVVNGGSEDATITLPTVPQASLHVNGETAGQTFFTMALTGCLGSPDTTEDQVAAYFESGATVDATTGMLIPTGVGAPANLRLRLLDGQKGYTAIKAGDLANQTTAGSFTSITGGANITMHYGVEYYATGAADAGTVTSSVIYTLQYQ